MTTEQIIQDLNLIFRNVLDNDAIVIGNDTRAKDVEEWDSLNHIQLVVEIEKHYKIRFSSSEIQGWQNVGEIANSVGQKLLKK